MVAGEGQDVHPGLDVPLLIESWVFKWPLSMDDVGYWRQKPGTFSVRLHVNLR
jgi:hypothetical protein